MRIYILVGYNQLTEYHEIAYSLNVSTLEKMMREYTGKYRYLYIKTAKTI